MSLNDRYAAVRKQRLCYGCLGNGHANKDCKVNVSGVNGCIKKHCQFQHSENQMDEGNHAVNVSAATINQSNDVTSFLQIVPASIQSGGNKLSFPRHLINGFVHRSNCAREATSPRHRCDAQHNWHTRNKGSEDRKGFLQNKGSIFKCAFNRSVCTPVITLEKHKLQLQQAEAKLQSLECSTQQKFQLNGS